MSNIIPISEIRVMAKSAASSKMFSAKAEEQIFMLMLLAQSENIPPIKALMAYDVINGQPALKASEALARYMDCGGKIEWIKSDEHSAKARFTHASSGSFEYEYTVKDATDAGLIDKDNWKKNLKAMLRARCTSAGIRMSYPRCLNNMYTADEVRDFEPTEEPKDDIQDGIIIDDVNIETLKKELMIKLRKLDFTNAMMKEFYIKYVNDDEVLLRELTNNNDMLIEYVNEFEGKK